MITARELARDVLVRVEDGAYSNLVLPELLRRTGLSSRDRAFVTELVYGTLRARRRLDDRLATHLRRPLDALDPPVRAALRLGAYQLEAGVAPHAAVGETVEVTPPRARGFVNGVLRALAATGPPFPEQHRPGVALSYPDWIVDRLTRDLGADEARAALEAQNEAPVLTLRPNPRRTTPAALVAELTAAGASVVPGRLVTDAVGVRGAGDTAALAVVHEGRATPQDEASQAVVTLLDAQPGDRVLDVAAAPGGKATGVGERVGDDGLVVAADIHPGRLRLVADAARRLGLTTVRSVLADGRRLPVRDDGVDRVLVDAPCSGLGVLRRRPEARWRVGEPSPDLVDLQTALVLTAAPAVRPGGQLLYSVCTLTRAETTGVAARVLSALGDTFAVLDPPPAPWRPWGPGALLLPHDANTDGMFVLSLRRVPGAAGTGR
ncbi:MAG TPA: 16S rRNA (cytosine(967)-C(5))-methyltransferase RsmB [Acidimicrobiia bacterium]|nr:16S rRNA (cytosine(967)-C(5))-methyltransferase RsmB [Acidimicrobiia bacterium]